MAGAIWSMPQKDIMDYPVKSLFQFFNNHKLLHGKKERPKWLTVSGGSINYVNKIIKFLQANPRVKLIKSAGIKKIRRDDGVIKIIDTNENISEVDHIIFSQNPSKVLNCLSELEKKELDILGKFKANTAGPSTAASTLISTTSPKFISGDTTPKSGIFIYVLTPAVVWP